MTIAVPHNPEDDALAGEYVLGVLPPRERQDFVTRMRDDRELQKRVSNWDHLLIGLAIDFEEVRPPASVKRAIDEALFGSRDARQGSWLGWLSGAISAAAIAAAVLFVAPTLLFDPATPTLTHVVEVADENRSLVIAASFSAQDGALIVRRLNGQPAAGRVHQMWLIPEGADAPISLGVIPDGSEAVFEVPPALRDQLTAALFAISDEPTGGSPTGQPTGAVLAAGPIQTL